MTKELFTTNIQSSTISLFIKALIASAIFVLVMEIPLIKIFGEEHMKYTWGNFHEMNANLLSLLGVIIFSLLFFICLRGFVGHLKPVTAFKKVFIFFFIINSIFGMLGILLKEQSLIYGIVMMFMNATGNAIPAYFLAKTSQKIS